MRTADRDTATSNRKCFILTLLFCFFVPTEPAHAAKDECADIATSVSDLERASLGIPDAKARLELQWAAPISREARACLATRFFFLRNTATIEGLTTWQKEQLQRFQMVLPTKELWDLCFQLECRNNANWHLTSMKENCSLLSPDRCAEVDKKITARSNQNRQATLIPKKPAKLTTKQWVLAGFSIAGIVVGSASTLLGVSHAIVPVVKVPTDSPLSSCTPSDLQLPCVANRNITAGSLIGSGLALLTVGGLGMHFSF